MKLQSPLGAFLKKLRIDLGITQKQMSADIEVTSTFLSTVEAGRKPAPSNVLERISQYYQLSPDQVSKMNSLATAQRKNVRISLEELTDKQRELAIQFAENVHKLDADAIWQITNAVHRCSSYKS